MITSLFLIYIFLYSVNVDVVLKANETESETHYQFLSLGNIVLSKLETSVLLFCKKYVSSLFSVEIKRNLRDDDIINRRNDLQVT